MRMMACACALVLAALPAGAQGGNGSDVTGPGLTNGGMAGGSYEAGGFRRTENAIFRTPNGRAVWASGEVACAVSAEIPALTAALRDGPLPTRPETDDGVVSDSVRGVLWGVLRGDSVDHAVDEARLAALLRGAAEPDSRLGRRAASLAEALSGLLGKGATCPARERFLVAEPWENAVQRYDRYLDARDPAAPAGEAVTGIHAVLATFMEAAMAAGAPPR